MKKIAYILISGLMFVTVSCSESDDSADSPTGEDCATQCTKGQTACVSGNVSKCEIDAAGCPKWVVQTVCSAQQTCDAGTTTCKPRDTSGETTIRFMAGNITSGLNQTYDMGDGTRIFEAFKPDIAMIQEFSLLGSTREAWVKSTFGDDFTFSVSDRDNNGYLPNGIISRYPIKDHGFWETNVDSARNWDWAVIDLPGNTDLLAISVHLHTSKNPEEIPVLIEQIKQKQAEGNYYVVIGGDFNTKSRNVVSKNFGDVFNVSGPWPVDQNGNESTDEKRTYNENSGTYRPLDWLLFSKDLDALEIPITIGQHTYTDGHIIDSRVYASCAAHNGANELDIVPPLQAGDSESLNMQHMAIIRDVAIK